ncbi:hypothetical protein ACUH7Y_09505 [Clostridium beijerinckii]|uniref:Uncharacterized protein n=1 Tax=Clostridium beijerinckii TaxID=1520 RepID=A0A7X9XNS3_CLOBE|nr:hypothetical protein [Clostridium beijerinckii]NMF04548.1 hypothetical protein [Clostridium beijerinckii]
MNYFNICIDKTVSEIKDEVIKEYSKDCYRKEKDDDGSYIKPSIQRNIESALENYFDSYGDIPDEAIKEYEQIYDMLQERLLNELNVKEIHESMQPVPDDYYGLTEAQRNSEIY